MRVRPVGPAQSSVFHNSARRGPTKEAHRRALNQPDGLLRSVAERLTSANRPRPAPPRSPTPRGTHQGRDQGPLRGPIGGSRGGQEIGVQPSGRPPRITPRIARRGRPRGRNRPRRGRDPAPGRVRPMPSPCGNTTRPDRRRHQGRSSSAARSPASWDGPKGGAGGLRALHLDPGSGPDGPEDTHSGVPPSAQRHPPGKGAADDLDGGRRAKAGLAL